MGIIKRGRPVELYHGTNTEDLPSILEQGLRIDLDRRTKRPNVFAIADMEVARAYAKYSQSVVEGRFSGHGPGVILGITPGPDIEPDALQGDAYKMGPVPPERIRVVPLEEQHEILERQMNARGKKGYQGWSKKEQKIAQKEVNELTGGITRGSPVLRPTLTTEPPSRFTQRIGRFDPDTPPPARVRTPTPSVDMPPPSRFDMSIPPPSRFSAEIETDLQKAERLLASNRGVRRAGERRMKSLAKLVFGFRHSH